MKCKLKTFTVVRNTTLVKTGHPYTTYGKLMMSNIFLH